MSHHQTTHHLVPLGLHGEPRRVQPSLVHREVPAGQQPQGSSEDTGRGHPSGQGILLSREPRASSFRGESPRLDKWPPPRPGDLSLLPQSQLPDALPTSTMGCGLHSTSPHSAQARAAGGMLVGVGTLHPAGPECGERLLSSLGCTGEGQPQPTHSCLTPLEVADTQLPVWGRGSRAQEHSSGDPTHSTEPSMPLPVGCRAGVVLPPLGAGSCPWPRISHAHPRVCTEMHIRATQLHLTSQVPSPSHRTPAGAAGRQGL